MTTPGKAAGGAGPLDPRHSEPRRTISDRILGIVGGGMIIAAVLLLLTSAAGRFAPAADVASPPALTLLFPQDGERFESPLTLRFQSEAPLAQMRGGWGSGTYHVHAEIDGREVMPASRDIRFLGDGSYEWTFGRIESGRYRLRLYWSDAAHRPLPDGGTPVVSIQVIP